MSFCPYMPIIFAPTCLLFTFIRHKREYKEVDTCVVKYDPLWVERSCSPRTRTACCVGSMLQSKCSFTEERNRVLLSACSPVENPLLSTGLTVTMELGNPRSIRPWGQGTRPGCMAEGIVWAPVHKIIFLQNFSFVCNTASQAFLANQG